MITLDSMIETMRLQPNETVVRYRINDGDWSFCRGHEFLHVWDQPFAGTIEIDCVYVMAT